MNLPSASEFPRVLVCPASGVLPRASFSSEYAGAGTAVHAYLANLATMPRDQALDRVSDEHRAVCEALDTSKLPSMDGARVECSLAWDIETGVARFTGENRDYRAADRTRELVGTLDFLSTTDDGEGVFVIDYKTGVQNRPPAAQDAQLWFGCLAAARATGKTHAIGAIAHWFPGSSKPRFDYATFDALALAEIEIELRGMVARSRALEGITNPPVHQGPHCQYCPSLPYCPATKALLVTEPADLESKLVDSITSENAAKAYRALKNLKRIAGRVEAVLNVLAAQSGGIELGDGVVWGPHSATKEVIDGQRAFRVLTEKLGADAAWVGCELAVSKASIERAVKPVAKLTGEPIAKLKREILDEISKLGGLEKINTTRVEEWVPKKP